MPTPPPATPTLLRGSSGIVGRTIVGPACPQAGVNQTCPDTPYPALITILGSDNRQVAQVSSDGQGRFQINLPPGTYILVPLAAANYPRPPQPQVVIVKATGYVSVTLSYDSGMR